MRLIAFAAAVTALPLAASADPLADRGYELAVRWCTACHVVAPGEPGGDVGPAFETLTEHSQPGLRAWLFDPHPPMPNLNLSADEVDAILAYIATLN